MFWLPPPQGPGRSGACPHAGQIPAINTMPSLSVMARGGNSRALRTAVLTLRNSTLRNHSVDAPLRGAHAARVPQSVRLGPRLLFHTKSNSALNPNHFG